MSRSANFVRFVRALRHALWGPPAQKPRQVRPHVCAHFWEVDKTYEIARSERNIGHSFYLKCRNCGDMIVRNLRIDAK